MVEAISIRICFPVTTHPFYLISLPNDNMLL